MEDTAAVVAQWDENNRQMWNDPGTVEFWRYWQYGWDSMVREVNHLIADAAAIAPNLQVLDLGSGHGEPALTLAEMVGHTGHVTATDLSAGMLALAEENAGIADLDNMTFRTADAEDLPFPSASFDAVTSRFGVMYFPDPLQACAEVLRVLRPSGRAAFAVWGPAYDVPWYALPIRILAHYLKPPPLDMNAPGPFRFGSTGSLSRVMEQVGFIDVKEAPQTITMEWQDSPDSYVTFLEALHWGLIDQTPESLYPIIREQFRKALQPVTTDGGLRMLGTIIIVSGRK